MEILPTWNKDCLGFNEDMEILSTRTTGVWVPMNVWKSCQQENKCLGFNEGMELLSTGNEDCLGFNQGIEILSTGHTACFGLHAFMEVLSTGKTNYCVPMKVRKSCQEETNTVWVSMKAWISWQQEPRLFGFQWRNGNLSNRKQHVWVSMKAWKSDQQEKHCLGCNDGM